MTSKTLFSIDELAAEADLPVRTVRYYITQGILEGPEGRGKNAFYSEEHLLKLRAARELKDQGVSLGEIRSIVPSLSSSDLQHLVSRSTEQKEREDKARNTSPKAYLSALLERPSLSASISRQRPAVIEEEQPPYHGGSEWRRIPLNQGLEVHVRKDMLRQYGSVIKNIVNQTGGCDEK
jgi:DNA-binding transcriptional MerR regulator